VITGFKFGRTILALVGLVFPLHPAFAEPTMILQGGSAQEVEVAADDSVIHHDSKFVFPSRLGDMPVRKIIVYGPGDVSVDYTLRGGGNGDAWISLFVYPAAHNLTDEAADIEATLIDRLHPSRIPAPRDAPSSAADGRNAWYHGAIGDLQLTSAYVVVRRGDWFIEARASIPDAAGSTGIERTLDALDAIPWDWRSGKGQGDQAKP
jgi:hypothetical protein